MSVLIGCPLELFNYCPELAVIWTNEDQREFHGVTNWIAAPSWHLNYHIANTSCWSSVWLVKGQSKVCKIVILILDWKDKGWSVCCLNISVTLCKTTVSPVCEQWRYHCLTLKHFRWCLICGDHLQIYAVMYHGLPQLLMGPILLTFYWPLSDIIKMKMQCEFHFAPI